MLDKIILSNDRKQATMVFIDKGPVTISSDQNVVPLLMWFLNHPRAHLIIANDNKTVIGLELREFNDEITLEIKVDVA